MRPTMIRSFQISDALVLVAATGLGMAGCRFWVSASGDGWGSPWPSEDRPVLVSLWIAALRSVPVVSLLLLCWTTAVLLLRLRSPRPRRRHLWCQPGFLACVAAVFVFAWKLVGLGLLFVAELLMAGPADLARLSEKDYGPIVHESVLLLFSTRLSPQANTGGAVLLLWLVCWAGGRCRPEPSWVDRSGRLLGAAWVGISLLAVAAMMM